ncbi:preprotein translocase subunit SecG [Patescibacteria group bacterium]|nr:preprotein translocase subunit SecG [Patescibacteria group bacterium]
MLTDILMVAMIIISISLLAVILIQKKGSGIGAIFGGGGEAYRSKRGAEKILHYLTIVLAFLFATISFSLLFIK